MRLIFKILALSLAIFLLAIYFDAAFKSDTTPKQTTDPTHIAQNSISKTKPEKPKFFIDPDVYDDIRHRYYGRLYIPDLDISVALYNSLEQYITDREDAANIFGDGETYAIIADHSNQEFSKLFGVRLGTKGYIKNKFMQTINIECTSMFHGYNAGYDITDRNGNNVMGLDDYLMYTCDSHGSVFICLWTID